MLFRSQTPGQLRRHDAPGIGFVKPQMQQAAGRAGSGRHGGKTSEKAGRKSGRQKETKRQVTTFLIAANAVSTGFVAVLPVANRAGEEPSFPTLARSFFVPLVFSYMTAAAAPLPTHRPALLQRLAEPGPYDVVVIGGGATGLGVALDAATRGLKTLLLEAHDFAKGTSSRATKLVHGGVRYLAQGNVALVREALRERAHILTAAPHLAQPLAFVMPAYQ